MDKNSPISTKRQVFINDVFKQELRFQRIDYDMVKKMAASEEFDHSDGTAASIKLRLGDGRVLVLKGFCSGEEFHVDDHYCQQAG